MLETTQTDSVRSANNLLYSLLRADLDRCSSHVASIPRPHILLANGWGSVSLPSE